MRLQEIPALPFALDPQSVGEWLDRLPVANIRECCRLLFPVIQALNLYPMAPRLRFEIFEECNPIVLGIARDLHLYIMDRALPLDAKTRKIASLPARFHIEAADSYRQLLENEASGDLFSRAECTLILRRALEHLSYSLLLAAQTYDPPPSSIDSKLSRLYRYALSRDLLNESPPLGRERAASALSLFAGIALFRLIAPGRLAKTDIQHLFSRFLAHDPATEMAEGHEEGTGKGVFYYDPQDINVLVPAWSTAPPAPNLPFFTPETFLGPLRVDFRVSGGATTDSEPLVRALSRIGERLPCQDLTGGGRRVALHLGFDPIVAMVRDVEVQRQSGLVRTEPWSLSNQLELAPVEPMPTKFVGLRSLTSALRETEAEEGKRRISIVPTELPGFYLIDSEDRTFRAGQILGMNSDGQWIQLAVVRSGQIRDGRFWHSVELLGTRISSVKIGLESSEDISRPALLLDDETKEPTLVMPPTKSHRDTLIVVRQLRGKRLYRIGNLLEATTDFHHYTLTEADAAKPGN